MKIYQSHLMIYIPIGIVEDEQTYQVCYTPVRKEWQKIPLQFTVAACHTFMETVNIRLNMQLFQ